MPEVFTNLESTRATPEQAALFKQSGVRKVLEDPDSGLAGVFYVLGTL